MEFKKMDFESPPRMTMNFITPFRAIFIFRSFQSELYIKSYGCLKFFRPKFLQLKIYDKSIQRKNSIMKYTLNQVADKTIGPKPNF